MEIRRETKQAWLQAYNILCRTIAPLADAHLQNPFALTECSIEPLGQSEPHLHDDQELFIITSGYGMACAT